MLAWTIAVIIYVVTLATVCVLFWDGVNREASWKSWVVRFIIALVIVFIMSFVNTALTSSVAPKIENVPRHLKVKE